METTRKGESAILADQKFVVPRRDRIIESTHCKNCMPLGRNKEQKDRHEECKERNEHRRQETRHNFFSILVVVQVFALPIQYVREIPPLRRKTKRQTNSPTVESLHPNCQWTPMQRRMKQG